ncbi:hypothetical protein D9M72_596700 [compost metagenome]
MVSDLCGEVIALTKDLAHLGHDFLRVRVILTEDKCLWDCGASGKDFGEKAIAERFQNGSDLVGIGYRSVELRFLVL